jgi:hypothetical protein
MLKMPHRNVTRFFIPLIDVLILLFCIFLLMDFSSEEKYREQSVDVELQTASAKGIEEELTRRNKELQKFEELRPQLTEMDKMREELERLRGATQQNLQDRAFFRIIDIDGKDGSISFYDENNAEQPIVKIPDARAARALIEKHAKEAKGRELYYYFMPPRPLRGYPTAKQNRQYKEWFAKTANSLAEKR